MTDDNGTPITKVFFEALDPQFSALKTDAIAALPEAEKNAIAMIITIVATLVGVVEGVEQVAPGLIAMHAKHAADLTDQMLYRKPVSATRDDESRTTN